MVRNTFSPGFYNIELWGPYEITTGREDGNEKMNFLHVAVTVPVFTKITLRFFARDADRGILLKILLREY